MSLRSLIPFLSILLLSSCIEIIDDITIHADGSGTFRYNLNLSSSKAKINSLLALDSLDGKRMPSLDEIREKVNTITEELKMQDGITNVTVSADYENYILKISCDFGSIGEIQKAVKNIAYKESKLQNVPELEEKWMEYSDNTFMRSIPDITIKKASETNKVDINLLKSGTYTSITRFDYEIDHFTNTSALLSKNKKAIMVKIDPYKLTENSALLDNTIYLNK